MGVRPASNRSARGYIRRPVPGRTVDRARRAFGVRAGDALDRVRVARGRRNNRVLVLGDSHAGVFRHPSWRTVPVLLDVHAIGGATLTGLGNAQSASGARKHFDSTLTRAVATRRPPNAIVTLLGEVDCGFILWRRQERTGTPLDALLDQAVDNYRALVAEARTVAPVAVVSAPLPTLTDLTQIGDYAGQRRDIKATRPERTALARNLNARCAAMAREIDATFVDLDPASLGPDGEVSELLVGLDPRDHHYDAVVYARLLQRALAPVLGYRLKAAPLPPAEGGAA